MRRCIVCGTRRPKPELVRLALGPDGAAFWDPEARRGGRGAYVCRTTGCKKGVDRPGLLARAFRSRGPVGLAEEGCERGQRSPAGRSGIGFET